MGLTSVPSCSVGSGAAGLKRWESEGGGTVLQVVGAAGTGGQSFLLRYDERGGGGGEGF